MKTIKELTEQEVLSLSDEDIVKMIKYKMADEGIVFVDRPKVPCYIKIPTPKTKVYYCNLLGEKISFINMEELNSVIELLNSCETLVSVTSDYDLPEENKYKIKDKVENISYHSGASDTITPVSAYTNSEYILIKEDLRLNKKYKKEYDENIKLYNSYVSESKWIKDDIMNEINEVREKYNKLNNYAYKYAKDYLPLSDNNEDVAMKFLKKAYSLNEEEQEYVTNNYKNYK